jgi:hypothetical protein
LSAVSSLQEVTEGVGVIQAGDREQ